MMTPPTPDSSGHEGTMIPDITINALHDPISIVHVPVDYAQHYSTKLYWTLDRAAADSAEFFNLTSNRIEIALFATTDLIDDEWGADDPNVLVDGPWRVFEISSGDDGSENYDSPHLRHVSAPLAAAGVSILYQSSYFTDFLLVRSSHFQRASAVFNANGWRVDPLAPPPRRRSVQLSPGNLGIGTLAGLGLGFSSPPTPATTPPVAEITVLAVPLGCVGLPPDAEARTGERLRRFLVWPERTVLALEHERSEREHERDSAWGDASEASHPTTASAAGSRNDRSRSRSRSRTRGARPFISFTRTKDGASILTETRILKHLLRGNDAEYLADMCGETGSDSEELEWGTSDERSDEDEGEGAGNAGVQPEVGPSATVSPGPPELNLGSSGSLSTSNSSPLRSPRSPTRLSGHSLPGTPTEGVHPYPIHWASQAHGPHGGAGIVTAKTPLTPMTPIRAAFASHLRHSRTQSEGDVSHMPTRRVSESASLRPAWERDEAAANAATEQARACRPTQQRAYSHTHYHQPQWPERPEDLDPEPEPEPEQHRLDEPRPRAMRCLQLDMRAVGKRQNPSAEQYLNKSGLVTRFSGLMHSGGVKMLYSSTTHTANILVEGRDVWRAEQLLLRTANRDVVEREQEQGEQGV